MRHPYAIISAVKCALGILIMGIIFTTINVYEDPAIGITLFSLGIFITAWGGSFFLFRIIQKRQYQSTGKYKQDKHTSEETIMKESYKLSLLFGIFIVINILLILLGYRTKRRGFILLGGFIALQISLFGKQETQNHGHNHH